MRYGHGKVFKPHCIKSSVSFSFKSLYLGPSSWYIHFLEERGGRPTHSNDTKLTFWIDSSSGIQNFRKDHPITATAVTVAGVGLVTAGSMVLAPAILVGGLNAVGFTESGVAAGIFFVPYKNSRFLLLIYDLCRFHSRWNTI